jgi:drug/metabolite transporter (DMT)-like permease
MTPADAVLIALVSAFTFAVAEIAIRNALRFSTTISASILTLAVQFLMYTVLLLVTGEFTDLNAPGLFWFLVAGFMNPLAFMAFYLIGMQRIGVARSAPIKGSAPLFAVLFAAGYLGERLEGLQYLGIALVVGGVLVISTEGRTRAGAGSAPGIFSPKKLDFLFPLLAGVSGGVASVLFKVAVGKMPSPLLGAWIGTTEGLLLFPLVALLFPPGQRFQVSRPALPWIVLAGISAGIAYYGLVATLGLGQVSIVFTLVQTSPLMVVLMSVLFLRQLERVTLRVILGGLMTVGGAVMVSVT